MRAQSPDVGLVYGSPILRPELFEIPRLGTLGIHHGRMPEYRGKKTTFWALYNGDPTAGVTIQKINAGLDTGTIVAEGHVDARGRSLRAVWNDLEQRGLDLYITAIPGYVRGELVPSAWDGPRGKLYRDPGARDILRFIWRRYRPGSK
jgi:methionyl-tRNA formyltransferase